MINSPIVGRDFHDYSVFCPLGAARIAAGDYRSTMRWTRAADEHRKAKSSGLLMPIIFGDAQFNSTHLFKWAQLDTVTADATGTRIRFSNVQDLGGHFATELIKESDGSPISINVRRGYSVVKTPDFLLKRSRGASAGAEIGTTSAAIARIEQREAEIAQLIGLDKAKVRRRLKGAHGKTLVRNVFKDWWPGGDTGSEYEEDGTAVDVGTLGDLMSTVAREGRREADIASVTGLSAAEVRRRLASVHGKTLIRNLFKDHWPVEARKFSKIAMRQGAVQQSSLRQHKRLQPSPTMSLQGRPDHQKMQQNLVDLGEIKKLHVRTNHQIGAGFMPDVLWFRLNPSEHKNAAPIAAFEIEFGSAQAIAKSLSSLKHAFDLGTHKLFLILPSGRVDGAKHRLGGAFHEIADAISVLPIESTIRMTSVELARYLDV